MKKQQKDVRGFTIRKWKPVFLGLVFGVIFLCLSLLPSLLPRTWWLQGIISGISVAVGYGIGVAASSLFRWFTEFEFSIKVKHQVWDVARLALPALVILFLGLGVYWQDGVREIMGEEPMGVTFIIAAGLMTMLITTICMYIGWGARKLVHKLFKLLHKRTPKRVAAATALIAGTLIIYGIASGVLFNGFVDLANNFYGARDTTAPKNVEQPKSSMRSGSSESKVPWDKIGYQGRGFVGSGPSDQAITNYTHQPAKMPIRVYAGLSSANSSEERARLVVAELKRTGAFNRKVLVIATPTGTGWLDPKAVDALEFMYNGDTAIAGQQYSYLPSWISFLVDQDKARETGRALYDAVIEAWGEQPVETRPKLLVYGLSLGSFGGQAAFSGANDMRRSVDGALFTGTPNDTETWRKINAERDPGTPEWQPTYNDGTSVRYASNKEDILRDPEGWSDPTRILYQQHASDPVVWFSFDLIFHKPDWLSEPRGRDVSSATRWYPIVTFLQIGLDQALAGSAPVGHGHYYIDTTVYAWAGVLPPEGWNVQKSDALQKYINDSFDSKAGSL